MSSTAVLRCIPFVVLGVLLPLSGQAQQQDALPSERSSVQPFEAVPVQRMPAIDSEARPTEKMRTAGHIGPVRYGTVLDTRLTPRTHGTWEQLPSGRWLWRVRIQSAKARSLSLGFSTFDLPEDSRLFVHDGDGGTVRGPYTRADATGGAHWTPLVEGEAVVVELDVPRDRRADVDLVLSDVVHADRAILPRNRPRVSSKAGRCNLDVACDEADPWRRQERSVAHYSYEDDGSAYVCTGSLMNNTAQDGRPLFLTAEHCVSSPSVAQSMVFYWNYRNATCRTPGSYDNGTVTGDDRDAQTSSGALLRARYGGTHQDGTIAGKPDLALVEVDDDIPTSYDLYFNGWSRAGTGTTAAATIHHPQGHGKRISFDRQPTAVAAYGKQGGSGTTHLRVGNWERGTTERGSSGAPLYDPRQRVVGVLSGGLAGCGGGGAEDNDKPDWYGRIAPGFTNGDYTPDGFSQPATLADWLDPANTGAQGLDGRSQAGGETLAPPSIVTATAMGDSIQVDWDASAGDVAAYRVYRARAPVDSTPVAQAVTAPVAEVGAGTTEVVDTALLPDTSYHYRVAAVNSADHEGPFSAGKSATVTVPGVGFADGQSYSAPAAQPGTPENPVGRFVLSANQSGATLSALQVEHDTAELTGVNGVSLWRSSDRTFDANTDAHLATSSTATPAVFNDLGLSVPTDSTYLFLTLDLEADASGEYQPVLRSEEALSFSGGTLATVNDTSAWHFENAELAADPAPLPVELLRFDARIDGEAVLLRWTTASERNNAGFRVQRRVPDASAFGGRTGEGENGREGAWTTVGRVDGPGTTAEAQSYRFTDAEVPDEADALTYRLKQVDADGSTNYTKTITVERGVNEVQLLGTVPNPARRQVTVRYALPAVQDLSIALYDVLGRRVRWVQHGEVPAGRHERSVDVSGLSNGVYVLRLRAGGTVQTQKVVVVR